MPETSCSTSDAELGRGRLLEPVREPREPAQARSGRKHALVVVQAFPPLLKNAGGVAKRYLTLIRALIDRLDWCVTLMTPVDVRRSGEPDVDRWLEEGSLVHLRARGVRISSSADGDFIFLDLFSVVNTRLLLRGLRTASYSCIFADDIPWRVSLLLLARAAGVPAVVSSHTDATHMQAFSGIFRLVWFVHMTSTRLAAVHATVSRVFGDLLARSWRIPSAVGRCEAQTCDGQIRLINLATHPSVIPRRSRPFGRRSCGPTPSVRSQRSGRSVPRSSVPRGCRCCAHRAWRRRRLRCSSSLADGPRRSGYTCCLTRRLPTAR